MKTLCEKAKEILSKESNVQEVQSLVYLLSRSENNMMDTLCKQSRISDFTKFKVSEVKTDET